MNRRPFSTSKPSAYKWRPLPAGALGHSVNPETIRRNEHRASLTPLETAFQPARANRGNRIKPRRDFARRYDEYQALDDETKAQVDQEMIVEENEVLEQEGVAILADWWRYYPNEFGDDGLPLVNPPTPIEVDSPPNEGGIACISITKDEARSAHEESARPCGEATQKLITWVCAGTASGAFCISGRSSPPHRPGSDSGAQSFTHHA